MPPIHISDEEYAELLKGYDYNFKKGDLVHGTVINYDSEGAIIDIGSKTSALCPSYEIKNNKEDVIEQILEKNKEYEFLITDEEDENGKFTVSYKKVAAAYSIKKLEEIKAKDEIVTGVIVQSVKGGLLVDVMGVRGFVPSSHLRLREDENNIIGKEIELKILTIDSAQNNFILSNRKVYTDSIEEIRKDIFSQLEEGQVVKGEVVRIADFGAFVDIGGVDALLPLSQISWRWVEHPSDILKIGEKINVEILSIDYSKHRVSLSLKNLEPDPWVEAKGKIAEGAKIKGKIIRVKHFGAFVEVYPAVEALLPQADVVEYQNKANTILSENDVIDVLVTKFNPDDRRIALSIAE